MKKLVIITLASLATGLVACNGGNKESKERQDSVEAAAAADSMLRDATQEADTTVRVDSVVVDTTPVKDQKK